MSTPQFDPQLYKVGQRQQWDAVAAAWKKWWAFFERSVQQVSDRLVDLAGVQPGQRVLDIATGIGEPAVTAAQRVGVEGHVVATDQSPGMLAVARERIAEQGIVNIQLVEVDTEVLDLPQESFDTIVCRWGLMFLPDLDEALRRTHRALKTGGKFATTVWATADKVPFVSLPFGVAQRVLQPPPPPPPTDAPNIFKLGEPGLIESAMERAGFKDVRSEVLTLQFEIASAEQYREFISEIVPPIRALVSDRSPSVQATFWNAIAESVQGFARSDGRISMPSDTIVTVGSK